MTDILPISFLVGIFLIVIEQIRNKFGYSNFRNTIQTIHLNPVSRFGGIAIFGSLALISFFSDIEEYSLLKSMLLCVCTIFFLGIIDDLEVQINPLLRLFIVFPSAFLSYYFLGIEAYSLEIPVIDNLFEYQFFSILFICFALAGIVNAFNMIDGVNGLVLLLSLSICTTVIVSGLATISDEILLYFVALFFSILGIFLLNFPLGKIFLGDGGAYFLGAATAIGVIKVYQLNMLSPWYVLLVFIYPVTDVFMAVLRRLLSKNPILEPDNKHLHHLILDRVKRKNIKSNNINHFIVTSVTMFIYGPFLIGASYFSRDSLALIALSIIFIIFYICLYSALTPREALNKK